MVHIIVVEWKEPNEIHLTGKWIIIDGTLKASWAEATTDDELMTLISTVESGDKPLDVIVLKPSSMVNTGSITRLPLTQENLTHAIAEKH